MKTILTFLSNEEAVQSIDDIAKTALNTGAHLHVLAIGLATFVPMSIYAEVPYYDWTATYSQVISDTEKKAAEIEQHLKDLGVSYTVSKVNDAAGTISSTVAQYALYADFAMVPISSNKDADETLGKLFIDGVMFNATLPTILLPSGTTIEKNINKAVIGWHPSPNAAAAVRSSLLLLDATTDVSIVIVDPTPTEYGEKPGAELAAFLSRRNVKATINTISSESISVGDRLVEYSSEANADLLVMGAYGRSRFSEWLLGGTTKDVFESLTIPTLVSH